MSGRHVHPFITQHFIRVEKKDDESNRWYWDCNFCTVDNPAGHHILGRNNKLFLLSTNTTACLNAPAKERREAEVILMEKGKLGLVERLFSDLGGIQGVKRCNFTVDTFETMGKLRANYSYHIFQRTLALGKPTPRCHVHMHTHANQGINVDLATDIQQNFTWTPPLASLSHNDDDLEGPENIRRRHRCCIC